jgi:hypothetical protein
MTQAISNAHVGGLAGELAVLLIENETNQAESARIQRDAAREEVVTQANEQVAALRAAANASMTGAFVSAAFSVAGGACEIDAACAQYDVDLGKAESGSAVQVATDQFNANLLGKLGDTLGKLSAPADAFGNGTAERFQAEAKSHETRSEQAKWQASDESTAIDQADRQRDKVLEALQSIQGQQNATNSSIIGRI